MEEVKRRAGGVKFEGEDWGEQEQKEEEEQGGWGREREEEVA